MASNLTTLANLKAWLGIPSNVTSDDAFLNLLIKSTSQAVMTYLMRSSLYKKTYTNEIYDGKQTTRIYLKNWPVLSVSGLVIGNQTVQPFPVSVLPNPTTACGTGYVIDAWDGTLPGYPQALSLRSLYYPMGNSNVAVTYAAGYSVQNEAQTIPSGSPYTLTAEAPDGTWMQDDGVTYATTGVAILPVAANPTIGQYSVAAGVYTFAAADAGKAVLISYSYVPAALEQACYETAAERYSYKQRIGQKSKSLASQETISYDNSGMTSYSQSLAAPFRRTSLGS